MISTVTENYTLYLLSCFSLLACEDAFTQEDDQWACCIGCNASLTLDTQNDDNLFEEVSNGLARTSTLV